MVKAKPFLNRAGVASDGLIGIGATVSRRLQADFKCSARSKVGYGDEKHTVRLRRRPTYSWCVVSTNRG